VRALSFISLLSRRHGGDPDLARLLMMVTSDLNVSTVLETGGVLQGILFVWLVRWMDIGLFQFSLHSKIFE
jgi:hypothetical protein